MASTFGYPIDLILSQRFTGVRQSILNQLAPHWRFALRYMAMHRDFCLLFQPKTFTQKLFYKLAHDRRPLLATFADKLQAREYVRGKVGDEILNELYLVTNNPDKIKFDYLPQQFVLKANHSSGLVRIVMNKQAEAIEDLRRSCWTWLHTHYSEQCREWAYESIVPKIMIERLIPSGSGDLPYDYKFFVFNGRVAMIQLDVDRFTGHKRNLYTPHWEQFDVTYGYPCATQPIPRPTCLEQMIHVSETLGADVDFIRVDLYESQGQVYFGELTNYPEGGSGQFKPKSFDAFLGAYWCIDGY